MLKAFGNLKNGSHGSRENQVFHLFLKINRSFVKYTNDPFIGMV